MDWTLYDTFFHTGQILTPSQVVTRFFVGYYPSKIFYILNILTMLGYAMVNDILGGQIIYTISGDHTNITIGIVIVAILTWAIATFGMHVFHLYSRYEPISICPSPSNHPGLTIVV